jgi:hypothetical protein
MAFWFVLFSTSCFANLLGLNISAAFKSAVTVYILIPLLLIPQMILSGLLFSYDKLNNAISQRGKVPLMADMMVSRWAFEAMAVHQFVNNDYGSSFYKFNRAESEANLKATFISEELRKRNTFVMNNLETKDDSVKEIVKSDIRIIRKTLAYEGFKGADEIVKEIDATGYTKSLAAHIETWLDKYKRYYQKSYTETEAIIDKLMAFHEKNDWKVNEYKNEHFNESLNDLVRNVHAGDPVIEYHGELVQQLDPIYQAPTPTNVMDYRTGFFLPEKNFLGATVPTYVFNVIAIWTMCLVLYFTLAIRLPQRILERF